MMRSAAAAAAAAARAWGARRALSTAQGDKVFRMNEATVRNSACDAEFCVHQKPGAEGHRKPRHRARSLSLSLSLSLSVWLSLCLSVCLSVSLSLCLSLSLSLSVSLSLHMRCLVCGYGVPRSRSRARALSRLRAFARPLAPSLTRALSRAPKTAGRVDRVRNSPRQAAQANRARRAQAKRGAVSRCGHAVCSLLSPQVAVVRCGVCAQRTTRAALFAVATRS